ncbi:MAG: hypothetical protein V1808_00860 [Candidatus Daviesbacteria bacterium]
MIYKAFFEDLITILTHVVENNIYGSVEIFFEKGEVTQITQRTIKKVHHPDSHSNFDINQKQSPIDSMR